jgi:hypothetical protein
MNASSNNQRDNRSEYNKKLVSLAGGCLEQLRYISDHGVKLLPSDIGKVQQEIVDLLYAYVPLNAFDKDQN